jgi:hypothetical protein
MEDSMDSINDGGPTFPLAWAESLPAGQGLGMSLRAYFAAKAMQGLLANSGNLLLEHEMAAQARAYTDALIVALAARKAEG